MSTTNNAADYSPTQYNVQVGGTNGTLVNVVPSSTSGVPLISQGSSTNPTFGAAVVAGGGTGATSLTAYAVLCGGTTSTGTVQSIASVGTSGQVLTSNGAGALPTFQASSGGSGITTLDADSGSATGSTVTISGGTTGLTTTASSATMDLTGTLNVGHGGTGATTLTGVLIGNGTSAVTGNAITQHDVLIGGASNAITSVAPSATSGVPLISQGSSTNPTFGTAVVAGGGTGATSLTSHSLLLGNGSSAISALGAATNGQIPIGSTSNAPVLATITAGTGISVTNGAGSITIAATGGGSGITTLDGNTGSATGSTVTISVPNPEGTPVFTASAAAVNLTFTDANGNVAIGLGAFGGLTTITGTGNTLLGGGSAAGSIDTASQNVLIGNGVAPALISGNNNVIIGFEAGNVESGHDNIFIGSGAGENLSDPESSNIYLNNIGNAGESNFLRIGQGSGTGTQALNASFIGGIQGITVTGAAVLVSGSDQLGVAVSSKRFKKDIQDMGTDSDVLYKLRPVSFIFDQNSAPGLKDATQIKQYGLIAEEAIDYVPHVVNMGSDGKPLNISYDNLVGMLINEVQRLSKRIEVLESYFAKATKDKI